MRNLLWRFVPYKLKLSRLERVWNGTIEGEIWGRDG